MQQRRDSDAGLIGAFTRHPGLFVVALALLVVLSALQLLRGATSGDVNTTAVQVRADIASLAVQVGSVQGAVAKVETRETDAEARISALENRQSGRRRGDAAGATSQVVDRSTAPRARDSPAYRRAQ